MKLKMKVYDFQKALVNGMLPERRPQLSLVLGWLFSFFLAFVLASVKIGERGGPFGIAVTAIIGGTLSGLFAALGASVSYLTFLGLNLGVRFVATVFLTFTASYVFRELSIYKTPWFMPAISGFFTLLTGMLSSFISLDGSRLLMPVILHSALAFASAYIFREALNMEDRMTETAQLRHVISLMLLAACILMSLSGACIAGIISVGRVLALLAVAVTAYKCGAVTGAAAGLILGAAMDIASPEAPFYVTAYGVSALLGGIFSKHSRPVFALVFLLSSALSVFSISFNGYRYTMLYDGAVAVLVFMVLPNPFMNYLAGIVRPLQFDCGETGLRKYAAQRIETMGEAFLDLFQTVDSTLGAAVCEESVSKLFDRASELICSKCKNKNLCWNANYVDTLSAFNDTADAIRVRGYLLRSDLPQHFAESCLRADELVSAVNTELRGAIYRRRFQARLAENRCAAYSQYFHLSEILRGVSFELKNAYGPDPLVQRKLLRYLNNLDMEADISVFRDRRGRLHITLESTKLIRLLRDGSYLDKLSSVVGVRLCRPVSASREAEGRVTLLEAEPYSATVGIASLKKKGESVSGDRGTYFKTDQGVLYILLSDGMGSGESAAKESVAAVRILERFLRTGIDPALAMQMLNSMMLLKNTDEWGFATVDLVSIDLFTGDAAFYKYGAAPSFVRCGKSIRRINSESLAAGLALTEENAPDIVRMRLKPGNVALIASDGVLAETRDEWLRKLLSEYDGKDIKVLARETLQTALHEYGCSDDMTVLAIKMESRT